MSTGCCGEENEMGNPKSMMPEMAKKMMGNMQKKSFNPQEMCEQMTSSIKTTAKLAAHANSEVQMLFEEWAEQVEKEILNSLNPNQFNAEKISKELKVSEETVLYFLSRLIRDKKIKVLKLELL